MKIFDVVQKSNGDKGGQSPTLAPIRSNKKMAQAWHRGRRKPTPSLVLDSTINPNPLWFNGENTRINSITCTDRILHTSQRDYIGKQEILNEKNIY